MRVTLAGVVLTLLLAIGYIASPFWAAWTLREAIRAGDSATLERKVEWDSVRTTLKASLAKHAKLVPEIDPETSELARPGMWQRVKMAFGQSMIDSFVERYVTADGLPQLFEARKTFNSKVRGEPDPEVAYTRTERFKQFWSRLKRAEFLSATRIEIEIEDRRNPDRRYVSVLELKDFEWKLTGLAVVAAPGAAPLPLRALEASAAHPR